MNKCMRHQPVARCTPATIANALRLSVARSAGPDIPPGEAREVTGEGFGDTDVAEEPTWTFSRRPPNGTSRDSPLREGRARRRARKNEARHEGALRVQR